MCGLSPWIHREELHWNMHNSSSLLAPGEDSACLSQLKPSDVFRMLPSWTGRPRTKRLASSLLLGCSAPFRMHCRDCCCYNITSINKHPTLDGWSFSRFPISGNGGWHPRAKSHDKLFRNWKHGEDRQRAPASSESPSCRPCSEMMSSTDT